MVSGKKLADGFKKNKSLPFPGPQSEVTSFVKKIQPLQAVGSALDISRASLQWMFSVPEYL